MFGAQLDVDSTAAQLRLHLVQTDAEFGRVSPVFRYLGEWEWEIRTYDVADKRPSKETACIFGQLHLLLFWRSVVDKILAAPTLFESLLAPQGLVWLPE